MKREEKKQSSLKNMHRFCSLFIRFMHSFIRGNYYTMHSCFYLIRSKSIKMLLVLLWLLVTDQFKQFIDFNQSFDQIPRNQYWSTDFQFDWLVQLQQMPEIVESLWTPFEMCTYNNSNSTQNPINFIWVDIYEIKSQCTLCFTIWLPAITKS